MRASDEEQTRDTNVTATRYKNDAIGNFRLNGIVCQASFVF